MTGGEITRFGQLKTSKKAAFVLSILFTLAALWFLWVTFSVTPSGGGEGNGGASGHFLAALIGAVVIAFITFISDGFGVLLALVALGLSAANISTPVRWLRVTAICMTVGNGCAALAGVIHFFVTVF